MSDVVPLFSWLHLSDIHVGHGDAAEQLDQELVLNALHADLQVAKQSWLPRLDAVIVTGDLAFSGAVRAKDEYARVSRWLVSTAKLVGLASNDVFVVPGNHDVQRSVDDKVPEVGELVRALRAPDQSVGIALADPKKVKLLEKRFANFARFARQFAPRILANDEPSSRLFWMHRISRDDTLHLRLVGLNTAILSAKKEDEQGDFKRLQVGLAQMVAAFTRTPIAEDEIVIVLSHHPVDWLADAGSIAPIVKKYGHVHLQGHIHDAESERRRLGSGSDHVTVTAGAVHGDAVPSGIPPRHGYSVGSIWVGQNGRVMLRLWPRIWSKNHDFRVDHDGLPALDEEGRPWPSPWVDHRLRFFAPGRTREAPVTSKALTIVVNEWWEIDHLALVREVYRVAGVGSRVPDDSEVVIRHPRYDALRAYIQAQAARQTDQRVVEEQLEALRIAEVRLDLATEGVRRILQGAPEEYELAGACRAAGFFLKGFLAYIVAGLAAYQVDEREAVCKAFTEWFDRRDTLGTLPTFMWGNLLALLQITIRGKELVSPVGSGVGVRPGPYTRVYVPLDRIENTGGAILTHLHDSCVHIPKDVWLEYVIPQMTWQEMMGIDGWYHWNRDDSVYDTGGLVRYEGRTEMRRLSRLGPESNVWIVRGKEDDAIT